MNLPNDSIGVSDILGWRDCARRMSFQMQRWTEAGEPPEAKGPNTAYGTAFHDAVEFMERENAFEDDAVQRAFDLHARWLDPEDLPRLREDLATYQRRDYTGVRAVAVEGEFKVPLMEWEGRTIYFRFRLDRLYQLLDDESVFLHIDYKTGKWPKSEAQVHSDIQMWAYNWGIHEVWAECEHLEQFYDQLRYGATPTRKSDAQRGLIREWLVRQVTAILKDEDYADDGLLQPSKNEWCAYCSIMESCPIVDRYSDFALSEIAALAPQRKDGRKTVIDLDPSRIEEYVSKLDDVGNARKVLERFESKVREVLLRMPQDRREGLGYVRRERRADYWPPEALKAAHEALGDRFYDTVGLTKGAIERLPDPEVKKAILGMADNRVQTAYVQRKAA